ncbi:MAG TPA: (d)CMP kinase [Thermoanaerobaculia bacterium]|nr:(d)CMP kinase [Thermoanaerobaculia bacterium]
MTRPVIVAIDGPSGAGKSTVAKMLAERLGVPYIDTGAMYRAIGLAARRSGIRLPIEEPEAVVRLTQSLSLGIETGARMRVTVNGEDVTEAIREPEISRYASAVSAIPGVRRRLVAEQRRLAAESGGVMEGRDIGTKVFPDTPHKFFLTAPLPVRARRRAAELDARGTPQSQADVLAEMEKRDFDDANRAESPLTCDETYVLVDSGDRDAPAVAAEIERRVRGSM